MELFFSDDICDGRVRLDAEESGHCVRVLRHRPGDEISVIDGRGTLYRCALEIADAKGAAARVVEAQPGFGAHPYHLTMAVCPTKNIDRYEWFVEKATELGVDDIVPVIGEHSERRKVREDRLQKIALSAAKQSLKGAVPVIAPAVNLLDYLGRLPGNGLKFIAYCSDDVSPRGSIVDALLAAADPSAAGKGQVRTPEKGVRYLHSPSATPSPAAATITILIGPEGDFSQNEVQAAMRAGFEPVHLGPSRLRTETAAITAVESVYLTLAGNHAYDSVIPNRSTETNTPVEPTS